MARKIKRFLVFILFSFLFTMFSKKFQSTEASLDGSTLASAKGTKKSLGQILSSVIGVNSAQAAGRGGGCGCVCTPDGWDCGYKE